MADELEHHRQLQEEWKKTTEEDKHPLQGGEQTRGKKAKRNKAKQ